MGEWGSPTKEHGENVGVEEWGFRDRWGLDEETVSCDVKGLKIYAIDLSRAYMRKSRPKNVVLKP